jgi:hypothetical protein
LKSTFVLDGSDIGGGSSRPSTGPRAFSASSGTRRRASLPWILSIALPRPPTSSIGIAIVMAHEVHASAAAVYESKLKCLAFHLDDRCLTPNGHINIETLISDDIIRGTRAACRRGDGGLQSYNVLLKTRHALKYYYRINDTAFPENFDLDLKTFLRECRDEENRA